MERLKNKLQDKYFLLEICVLLFISVGIHLISDLEYKMYEKSSGANTMEATIVWGCFRFLFLASYYWLILKKIVLKNRHAAVILSMLLYLIAEKIYSRYIMHGTIVHFSFLSDWVRDISLKALHRKDFYINFNYIIGRYLLPVTGLAYLVRSLKLDGQVKELKVQQQLAELKYLKSRLHPHFFFNTLNNIYALAVNQSPRTATTIAGLSNLMRYMIYEAEQPMMPLHKEAAILQEYVALEKIRYGEKFCIDIAIQGIQPNDTIPPLLFLPFIENAFKHGLEDATEGYVKIIICRTEDQLLLQVNNSIPYRNTIAQKDAGIGLLTAQQRLNLLYEERYSLSVTEQNDHYELLLTINLDA